MRVTRRPMVFGAVALGAALATLGPIADGDIFWHLSAGREMWHRKALLWTDPFTVSAFGRAWIDVHWIFQLVVALIHRALGFAGLAVAKAVLVAAGALILVRATERVAGEVARDTCAVVLLALIFLARHFLPMRPTLVTLLFVAIFIAVLEADRADRDAGRSTTLLRLAPLPLVQLFWVNCQGLAPLGLVLIACYAAGALVDRARGRAGGAVATQRLAVVFIVSVLTCLVTPYGLEAIRLPARLLARIDPLNGGNVFSRAIAENIPPFVLERTSPETVRHFRAVMILLGAVLAVARPRLPLAHALVLLAFAALALMANRNVVLFYWVLAPLGACALAPVVLRGLAWLRGSLSRPLVWLPRAALGLVLVFEVGVGGVALAREAPIGAPTPFHFPTESARWLTAHGAMGPVFAPDQHGGYLGFAVPGIRPYIDTRLILHTAREYQDYLALYDEPTRFDELDAREHFRYVVLTTAYPDRYLGLISHLAARPDWRLVYTDGYEVLFGREGAPLSLADRSTVDALAAALDRRYAARPAIAAAARLNLARLLIVVDQPAASLRVLAALDTRDAADLRVRAHFASGDLAAAEALARVLLDGQSEDVRSLTLLAQIALARRSVGQARDYLARALSAHPYDPEARGLLDRLEHQPPTRN